MKQQMGQLLTLFVLCLVGTTVGKFPDEFAKIIESKRSNDGKGNYEFQFRTSDGITRWEAGRLLYSGDKPYIHVEGGYSYIDRSYSVIRIVTFVADQNGYRPSYSQESATPLPQYLPPRFVQGTVK